MKKVVKLIFVLILSFIVLEIIFNIFKTKHDIKYELSLNDKTYNIHEIFKDKKYYIEIEVDKIKYSFILDNIYHKDKKIITDIKYYENDDLKCIYPNLDNGYVLCNKDNTLYSGYYFINDLGDFSKYLNTDYSNKTKNLDLSKVYYENIEDNTYIYIYKYNGVYYISDNNNEEIDMYEDDHYNNDHAILVDNYYVTFNYDEKYEYNNLYIYDITSNNNYVVPLEEPISKDSYINGIVDNKLYIFDTENLVQYEINPKKRTITEVGNKKDGALYYDKEFKTLDIYDFKKEELIFKDNDLEYNTVFLFNNGYYYLEEDNFIMHDSINDADVILFNEKVNNLSVVNNNIYFVIDNTLYLYNINSTFIPLVSYNELRFNSINRIFVYEK